MQSISICHIQVHIALEHFHNLVVVVVFVFYCSNIHTFIDHKPCWCNVFQTLLVAIANDTAVTTVVVAAATTTATTKVTATTKKTKKEFTMVCLYVYIIYVCM